MRRVDKRPCPDIPGGVAIGMSLMPTSLATKTRLAGAITAFNMLALRTHLRGIGWIDDLERHPGLLSLVGDKLPKLVESPATHAVTLRLAKPSSLADTLEVFKGDTAPSVFGLLNESLGKDVISVATKARFTLCDSLKLLTDTLSLAS